MPIEKAKGDCGIAFTTAEQYYLLAILADSNKEIDITPLVTNIVLACELYLKSIILYRKGEVMKIHNIRTLYEDLEKQDKEVIKKASDIFDFEAFLLDIEDAFIAWRYLFESCQRNVELSISICDCFRFADSLRAYYFDITK